MSDLALGYVLISAAGVQVLCQLFKVALYSCRDHKLSFRYFFTAGGMPSAHSAFVTGLTVAVGMARGVASELFAVAFVFAVVVVYDAFRLRGTVELHAKALTKLLKMLPERDRVEIPQMVGHSLGEIVAGMAAGAAFAVGLYFILPVV